ncbi:MAG: hypothetical protein V4608_09750 [Bacteroidota bacterium]
MIERIVKDPRTETFEQIEDIVAKFNHYRELSAKGLHNLSDNEIEGLKKNFSKFLNLNLTFFADTYPVKLFRVTNNKLIYDQPHYKLQKISDLIGPPTEKAHIGRCNLKDESVFYAALDFKTALWETQPQKGDVITVSEWTIKKGEKLNNHFIFHPEAENLNRDSKDAFIAHIRAQGNLNPKIGPIFKEIMKFFAEEFMKPVNNDKKNNYLFSSIISSQLLQTSPDENGFKVESISYPSTKIDHEISNIAILNSLVLKKLDLQAVTIFTVVETNYDLSNKKREDLIMVSALKTYHKNFDFEKDQIYYDLEREFKDAIELDTGKKVE